MSSRRYAQRRNNNPMVPRPLRAPRTATAIFPGKGLIEFVTATSAAGTFTIDSFDIDTGLLLTWSVMQNAFEQWRVRKMIFHYIPNCITSQIGTVYMAVSDDPNESSPISGDTMLSCRVSTATQSYSKSTMVFVPLNKQKWLYTRDQVTSDDRWEMPGVFQLATESFSTAQKPGRILVEYLVEFRGASNTTRQ